MFITSKILKKKLPLILVLCVVSGITTTNSVSGYENCIWSQSDVDSSEIGEITENTQVVFHNVKTTRNSFIAACDFEEPQSLEGKLINLSFKIDSSNYENIIIKLMTSDGAIFSSPRLIDWYQINPERKVNISIDPTDLELTKQSQSSAVDTDRFSNINKIQFIVYGSSFNSISLSEPELKKIEEHPDYHHKENVPVQSTIPGFLTLVALSFPIGFVLISKARIFEKETFASKIPLYLSFGFVIFLFVNYISALFWISFETVVIFLAFEIIIFVYYILKNKEKFDLIKKDQLTNTIFFSIIIVSSFLIQITYFESFGWPFGWWDATNHVPTVSYIMTNNMIPFGNGYPITQLDGIYPKGAHVAAAGVGLLSFSLPAVSMEVIFGFIFFLIPLMFASLVWRYTKSVLFSSIMFLVAYWRPSNGNESYWPGDIMLSQEWRANFASEVGIIVTLVSFFVFVEFFSAKNKKLVFVYFLITVVATVFSYFVYSGLPVIVAIFGIGLFYLKDKKKKFAGLAGLVSFFLSFPLWTEKVLEKLGLDQTITYRWRLYFNNKPFDLSHYLFSFWVSSLISFILAVLFIRKKQFYPLSIIIITIFIFHVIPLDRDLAFQYGFFYKALRSVGLMFYFGIAFNLIIGSYLFKKYFADLSTKKIFNNTFITAGAIIVLVYLLMPAPQIWDDSYGFGNRQHLRIPGGNERNLQFWLLENTDPNDLILNDVSFASEWFMGFRAQNLTNGLLQHRTIERSYDPTTKSLDGGTQIAMNTFEANKILMYPWDHTRISKIIEEQDIKYIYISERDRTENKCNPKRPICYPNDLQFAWKNYSRDARIAMYEDHPNLELKIRNGDSAVFQVVKIN